MTLHLGDCLEVMAGLPDASVDSIVTDPPYGLSFMGKKWDYDVPSVEIWAECLRVLKPGGHLLAFAGTRTQHRMACRIEDAGFEIRDMIAWVYSTGFPKSLDVSKALDKAAGAEREVVGPSRRHAGQSYQWAGEVRHPTHTEEKAGQTAPTTEAARQWQGWGTALKPALEPITLARKPLEGTVAANVTAHGTGGLNIDGCRVGTEGATKRAGQSAYPKNADGTEDRSGSWARTGHVINALEMGRWPANLIHDGSDEVVGLFPQTQSGKPSGVRGMRSAHNVDYADMAAGSVLTGYGDSGSAARFFYCAKASKRDRNSGLDGAQSDHPTVKPTDLMRYLCRLVTPPGGVVLDPFMGSGSTGKAAEMEGFDFIGIERDDTYFAIASARIAQVKPRLAA